MAKMKKKSEWTSEKSQRYFHMSNTMSKEAVTPRKKNERPINYHPDNN